jgi:hypothetical protein
MTLMDAAALTAALTKMGLLFSKPVTDELVDAWLDSLSDVPWPKVRAAIEDHCKHGKFWPRPGGIRGLIDRGRLSTEPSTRPATENDPNAPPHCETCQDTGWEADVPCQAHGSCRHESCRRGHPALFARPCSCRSTNPVYQSRLKRVYAKEDAA